LALRKAMKQSIICITLICTLTVPAGAEDINGSRLPSSGMPQLFVPPARVDRWISIDWNGVVNHPIMPVFYITEHRKAPPLHRYVYLTGREYRVLQQFSHSVQCSRENIAAKPPYPNTIVVQEYTNGRARDLCIFPKKGGCEYLFGVARLSAIDWSHKDTFPLFQFESELGCKAPLTKWHDAHGRANWSP
jgi:hypothetical protein